MEKQTLINKIPHLIKQRNLLGLLLLMSITADLFLCIALIRQKSTTIVIPSEISGNYKISGTQVNEIYLKDRANEIVKLVLNVTPNNLKQMQETILHSTPPKHHFKLKQELRKVTKEVISRNVSTAFFPIGFNVNTDDLTAQTSGELYTFFGGSVTKEAKTYFLKFDYSGSQLLLLEFYEVKEGEEDENAKN